jgi:hypothetical protein
MLAVAAIVVNQPARGTVFARVTAPASANRLPFAIEAEANGERIRGTVRREADGRIVLTWERRGAGCLPSASAHLELRSAAGIDFLSGHPSVSNATLAPTGSVLPVAPAAFACSRESNQPVTGQARSVDSRP